MHGAVVYVGEGVKQSSRYSARETHRCSKGIWHQMHADLGAVACKFGFCRFRVGSAPAVLAPAVLASAVLVGGGEYLVYHVF